MQALIVTLKKRTIKQMDIKQQFADRLNDALETSGLGVPPKGEGRQTFVARMFGVSQKGARKWLEAEGFPTLETAIQIARKLNISLEWLMTGRGPKRIMDHENIELARMIELWFKMPHHMQEQWTKYGEFLMGEHAPPPQPTAPPPSKKLQ